MIAGLEEITSGTVTIGGKVVNEVLPKDRDIAMVFQNYALYPHMTVYENMAFGLKLRKFPKADIDARVREAATMLGLEGYLARKPKALSGGQRQRVALGRAIVRKPKVFLFDEPLSNLDAKMRVSTRTEISKLHARLGATMIYVTHDQVEAMTMGDRICVMKDGNIMQVAAPLELYNHPDNLFVAGFIGSPPMNFFRGTLRRAADHVSFVEDNPGGAPLTVALDEALAGKSPSISTSRSSSGCARRPSTTPSPSPPPTPAARPRSRWRWRSRWDRRRSSTSTRARRRSSRGSARRTALTPARKCRSPSTSPTPTSLTPRPSWRSNRLRACRPFSRRRSFARPTMIPPNTSWTMPHQRLMFTRARWTA
jgi:ABC-type proline/glycine betaine transport system ATPase subunit